MERLAGGKRYWKNGRMQIGVVLLMIHIYSYHHLSVEVYI